MIHYIFNQNIMPAFLGLLASVLWIVYKQGWIKSIIDHYKKIDKKGVFIDSFLLISSPFIASRLGSYILAKGTSEIIKTLIPLCTFILGQYVVTRLKKQEKEAKEKAIMFSIWEELMHNLLILNENISLLKIEEINFQDYYQTSNPMELLMPLKTDFWDKMKYDFYIGHRYINNESEKTGGLILSESKTNHPKQLVVNTFMRIYAINRSIDKRNSKIKNENDVNIDKKQYRSEILSYGRSILFEGKILTNLMQLSMDNISPLIYEDI
jgi:hypothetical protein